MLYLLPFLTSLSENLQRVNIRVSKYLKTPNAKQIHDVRTSIRRLDATYLILPKKSRTGSSLSDYVLKCKEFFKVNSEIRDLDVIYEKLQKYPSNAQRNRVIEGLKASRVGTLERAKTIALTLKSTDTTKIIDKIGVTEKELQKRYSKMRSKLISRIESTFPAVLTNQAKLEELHELRISCKKLRYLLELLLEEKNNVSKTRKILQKLQDILGTIHDYDFTIEYLSSLEQLSTEIQEIITIEKEERNAKYHEFLKFCKRRLDISQDSFLIILKSLK
ncbi:MAG TPA: CHAD domain-containing protein [Nitrososphaeraceae archaeon]|nr:CHAD domain-containing protein [Nitrososphaeraceae archaeon]